MYSEFTPKYTINDTEYVQLICAFRLIFPDLDISLSTRETPHFRDHVVKLGITTISAESKTEPGGYSGKKAESQFQTSDHRSLDTIKEILHKNGYESIMKNWEKSLHIN